MRVLLLAALLSSAVASAADPDLSRLPYIEQFRLRYPKTPANDFTGMGKRLAAAGIYWFGYPDLDFGPFMGNCDGLSCEAYLNIVYSEPKQKNILTSALKAAHMQIVASTSNETASFIGINATLTSASGQQFNCDPKVWTQVPHWNQSFALLHQTADHLRSLSQEARLAWARSDLSCAANLIEPLTKIELSIDLTNEANCPLTAENLDRCFIGRGFEKQVL